MLETASSKRVQPIQRLRSIGLSDNGLGISADKLGEIFQYGFTTKKHGHGFGLHSSANVAVELGGSLKVASEGLGHGATFTLFVPFDSQGDVETKLAEEPAVVGAHP
jgi:C4-dicarboxylate-specific signal transduction histidine kinase